MKNYPDPRPVPRVPAFHPVPVRTRHDGWAPWRQATFLGHLAITGSVSAAARQVGMSREGAYRLRAQPGAESFAAAWDAVLGVNRPKPKVTPPPLIERLERGLIHPVVRRGKVLGVAQKPDLAALLALSARLERATRRAARAAAKGHDRKTARTVQLPACPLPPSAST